MAEWLFEILSEEIPSRMQRGAQDQLARLASQFLENAGLNFSSLKTFVTPRRLVLVVEGLALEQPAQKEERKGPRTDANEMALQGFMKSTGLTLDQCEVREVGKSEFYFAVIEKSGQKTADVLPDVALRILKEFKWPKSMRWQGPETWVRPLRGLLSVFEEKTLPMTYVGVASSGSTLGHRFLSSGDFTVSNFEDYKKKLLENSVIFDFEERRKTIEKDLHKLAQNENVKLSEDVTLLDEVTGLVEWPVVLKGSIDPQFMHLPEEVLITPMRVHQRYFPLRNHEGKLAPAFLFVANTTTKDQGKTVVIGNERVLRARLSDAKFFYEQDLKKPLPSYNASLHQRLFHAQLGTIAQKVERLQKLMAYLAPIGGFEIQEGDRAALLSKSDLATQMVGEFSELQGIMGRIYALQQKEKTAVAQAIEEHYWPKGSGDQVPENALSIALAIADRIDSLVGFFGINITPTGSKDPFALRRAALGLIQLILEAPFALDLKALLKIAYQGYAWGTPEKLNSQDETLGLVWVFLMERLKFFLRDQGGSAYDHVDAVLALAQEEGDLTRLAKRVRALDSFLVTENGENLVSGFKRATNILKIEEGKDKTSYTPTPQPHLFLELEEKTLFGALEDLKPELEQLMNDALYDTAMSRLARLRVEIDHFFERVTVNDANLEIRQNRLKLLALIYHALIQVADFSKLEG
ncbi:Glycine--tRNA ligase beta subunit [Candidatus Bealeia paramacronuclearis]|uniref:Glycine--tRNA ligase beta subunit n=1 Tax=Candidatus Bealeia paramacronuclearis TaxID=1921001 RepID=A0ABZ2C1U2_9PROT|nr:Glycine--tRNA ligase beta subunit [Candidatus Bealeia paramacronuclearis]